MVHIYNKILLSHKKDEILPPATTWVNLESLMLGKISQTRTILCYSHGEYKTESKQASNQPNQETQTTGEWLPEGKGSGRSLKVVRGVKYMVTEVD